MVFDYTLSMIANKRHLVDVNGDLIGMHDIAHIIRQDHVQNGQLVYDPFEDDWTATNPAELINDWADETDDVPSVTGWQSQAPVDGDVDNYEEPTLDD